MGALIEFKDWADNEFGSVRSAFKVLDKDSSGQLTYKEFRGACRNYGFSGDLRVLFQCLDQMGESTIMLKEVTFLDDWEMHMETPVDHGELMEAILQSRDQTDREPETQMLGYGMPTPGPGAYEVPNSFDTMGRMPGARHGGAFSFTCRRQSRFTKSVRSVVPSPANYDPYLQPTKQRKPAWTFGSTPTRVPSPQATPR